MTLFILATLMLIVALTVHVVIWRIRIPRKPYEAILLIFLSVMTVGAVVYVLSTGLPDTAQEAWTLFHVLLYYLSVSLAYTVTYSAIEGDSPTITIMKTVDIARPDGVGRERLRGIITDEEAVLSRLQALVDSGIVERVGDRFSLTAKGSFWQRIFSFWMRFLKIADGG